MHEVVSSENCFGGLTNNIIYRSVSTTTSEGCPYNINRRSLCETPASATNPTYSDFWWTPGLGRPPYPLRDLPHFHGSPRTWDLGLIYCGTPASDADPTYSDFWWTPGLGRPPYPLRDLPHFHGSPRTWDLGLKHQILTKWVPTELYCGTPASAANPTYSDFWWTPGLGRPPYPLRDLPHFHGSPRT